MKEDTLQSVHRRSIRYDGYDYTQPGAYFVTIVAHQRLRLFGEVVNSEMRMNGFGEIVAKAWEWLAQQYPYAHILPFIVMPNHFHGILQIMDGDDFRRGGSRPAPTKPGITKPLGQLVGAFKTRSAKQINIERITQGSPVWQRGYYEHIVRNSTELDKIEKYIIYNPAMWTDDPENNP